MQAGEAGRGCRLVDQARVRNHSIDARATAPPDLRGRQGAHGQHGDRARARDLRLRARPSDRHREPRRRRDVRA